MGDEKKFRALLVSAALLIACIFSYNIFGEYLRADIFEYIKRRAYYENVLKNKGLDLREGMHWRKKQ
ncbi:MAG: hypothetical protein HZB33_02360 [Nitrospirae bacterium]|nr:hypothetical protein [Nitrospirota bacterium]